MRWIIEAWRTFTHDRLGWGYPVLTPMGFDGCSFFTDCLRCDGKLLQDSQGNWFHTESPDAP